ncbi:MAG: DUF3999 domain-containing protein [Candidatus Methylopumilus sp.]|jgi:hypothetical protein
MKTHPLLTGLLASSLLWLCVQASATTFTLEAAGAAPLYRSELPLEVYQSTRQDDLSDLVIFNAAGERVPHALLDRSLVHPPAAAINTSSKLPVFPIQASSLTTVSGANDLRLQLEKSAGKTTVSITQGSTNTDTPIVYLLDAGEKHQDIQKLTLDWAEAEGRMIEVEVLASDDLNNWASIGHGILLKTSNTAGTIQQNTLTLDSSSHARYLQLRSVNPAQALKLTTAEAHMSTQAPDTPKLLWQNLPAANAKRSDNSQIGQSNIEFEAAGHYPAEYLRVNLPDDNTISSVKISVRNKPGEPWRYISNASVYHLVEKSPAGKITTLSSPDISIYPTVARYWQLQFNTATGGIGASTPSLALGWPTQTMVWNARGNAPFTLQTGQAEIASHVTIASLIPDFKPEKLQQLPLAAIQQMSTALPGETATKAADSSWSSAENNKRWWLCGGLLLGVLVLTGMALSLLRSDNKATSSKPGSSSDHAEP